MDAFGGALRATTPKPTDEQLAEFAAIRSRGVQDPRVATEGTLAYLITLDNGFRIMYRDSGGRVTDFEKSAMERIRPRRRRAGGGFGVLPQHRHRRRRRWSTCGPTSPTSTSPRITTRAYNNLWRATEPLFQAVKDENPNIVTVSKGYREPICFNTEHNISRKR